MKISTKGRYAIRLMIDIGLHKDQYVRLKDIARRQDISLKYLEQIISGLQKSGLLLSSRGAKGGYRLQKEASEYTVAEILRATEGSVAPVACLEDEENKCQRRHQCATLGLWEGLAEVVNSYLESHTLDELIQVERSHLQDAIEYSI